MKIRVTAKAFDCPAGSLVRLSHDTDEVRWKSLFDRYKAHLEKHGGWMRTLRKLQFKRGAELEIQGPVDRLVRAQFDVIEADAVEDPPAKPPQPTFKAPAKKASKKKARKKV